MIVGEPSLMGGEMDDEDERYITRLENTQYDPSAVAAVAAAASHHPPQYLSPTSQIPPGFTPPPPQQQQNPNLQSLLHQKQQFIPNSPLVHPNQVKREQMSFPGSPQQQQPQQQQQLPSMFSTGGGGPPTPNANPNVFPPPPSTPVNGDSSAGGKRIQPAPSNAPSTTTTTAATTNNSSNSPPTPSSSNHNQVRFYLTNGKKRFYLLCFRILPHQLQQRPMLLQLRQILHGMVRQRMLIIPLHRLIPLLLKRNKNHILHQLHLSNKQSLQHLEIKHI